MTTESIRGAQLPEIEQKQWYTMGMAKHRWKLCTVLGLALGAHGYSPVQGQVFDWIGQVEWTAKGLESTDSDTRLKAVRDLQSYAIEWTRGHLLNALLDADPRVRSEAGRVLAKHKVLAALPIVKKWLAASDAESKRIAVDILGRLGSKEALPALVRSLGDSDPVVRLGAVQALGAIGGSTVLIPLIARLEDSKSEIRLAAVTHLRELGDERTVIPLVGLFDDPNVQVRIAAIEAVGVLGDASAVPAIRRELGNRSEGVKIAAVTALGTMRAQAAITDLLAATQSGSRSLRSKAAYSLAQVAAAHPRHPAAKRGLTRLVGFLEDPSMHSAAAEALLAAGQTVAAGRITDLLIDHLRGKIAGSPTRAVELLVQLNDKKAVPALLAELERGRVRQQTVLQALQALGDSRALLPILGLLTDKESSVRLQAMQALGNMLEQHGEAADMIVARLDDEEIEIRILAARYLGQMRAQSAIPDLAAIVMAPGNRRLRSTALAALAPIGSEKGTEIALRVLKQGPHFLRPIAADVLADLSTAEQIPQLLQMIGEGVVWRRFAIEALGASLHGRDDSQSRQVLEKIARSGNPLDSLSAIEALSGMKGLASAPLFHELIARGTLPQRQASVLALGDIGDIASIQRLRELLHEGENVASIAALSLSRLADASASADLLALARGQGIAEAVNASAALAEIASKGGKVAGLSGLLQHGVPLVRANIVLAYARAQNRSEVAAIQVLAKQDSSWLVRMAALRTLSTLGAGAPLLQQASATDIRAEVRREAQRLLAVPFPLQQPEDWISFRVVDRVDDDKPTPGQTRFFVNSEGIATVATSDLRGRIVFWHFPQGPYMTGSIGDVSLAYEIDDGNE